MIRDRGIYTRPDGRVVAARPSHPETMMAMARTLARRSTCLRGKVGCVVTTPDGFVLSTGYNGAPKGLPHCDQVGACLLQGGHCVRSVHAEMNAIITAAREGVSLNGGFVYTTTRPCYRCAVAIIQAGLTYVVFESPYHGDDHVTVIDLLHKAGIRVWTHQENA